MSKTIKFYILLLLLSCSTLHAQIHIMPVGDSITFGDKHNDTRPGGLRHAYRNYLYYLLKEENLDFNFVGSVIAGEDVVPAFDPYNEGYPGQDSFYIADNIYDFLTMNPADIILLHIGTNDHREGSMSGMRDIFDEIDRYEHDAHHAVRVIVALIIQRQHREDLTIEKFNNNLAVLAHDLINKGDDIIVVDMENDANITSDNYADGTHPNDEGYQKMANTWVEPIMKERNDALYLFPISLVQRKYISQATINESLNSVSFETSIPDDGIQF